MDEQRVENHKVVTFTYLIKDEQGNLQEQSDIPMSYLHGVDTAMFPKIAEALEGSKEGDVVEITLSPEEGFGVHNPDLTFTDKIENVPTEYRHVGAEAMFQNDEGETMTMSVIKMDKGEIMLDGNHPFAGKTMYFKITVQGVRDATADEVGSGKVDGPQGSGTIH